MSGLDGVVDPGLLGRFRAAGERIQWRETVVARPRKKPPVARIRVAHLSDEEARVEERPDGSMVVDSGPVGALVLLLALDRNGSGARITPHIAGAVPGFDQGALEVAWKRRATRTPSLPVADLVGLARYALV